MKKILDDKIKLVLYAILVMIIITGTIILFILGFEKGTEYSESTRIEVCFEKGYDLEEVVAIAKESFNNKKMIVSEIEKLNQKVGIKLTEYNDEELENFKTKISEKFEINKDELEIMEVNIPEVNIFTLVKPYVMPFVLITFVGLLYMVIKNIRNGKAMEVLLKLILILVVIIEVYFSIILIFRLPFNIYTMPIALSIYIMSLIIAVYRLDKIN